jgi:hypothetical protein
MMWVELTIPVDVELVKKLHAERGLPLPDAMPTTATTWLNLDLAEQITFSSDASSVSLNFPRGEIVVIAPDEVEKIRHYLYENQVRV